ncbi:hypothetical protein HDV63DRAFT_382555 [Trichoderma sp. SZMC 28014]
MSLFVCFSPPETNSYATFKRGEIGLSKKQAGQTDVANARLLLLLLLPLLHCSALLCCVRNLVGWLAVLSHFVHTSRKENGETKTKDQARMVAVHAALCGLSKTKRQENSIPVMQCSASYRTVESKPTTQRPQQQDTWLGGAWDQDPGQIVPPRTRSESSTPEACATSISHSDQTCILIVIVTMSA